jgi:hypothetical protein
VDDGAGRLHHRVPLVVLHQLGQGVEDLAAADVEAAILQRRSNVQSPVLRINL